MRRSLNIFLIVFTSIHLTLTSYIAIRLAEKPWHWVAILILGGLLWSLPVVHWRRDDQPVSRLKNIFHQLSFVSMAVLSWLLVLTVARDLAILTVYIFAPAARVRDFWTGDFVFAGAALLTFAGWWWALRGPRVRHIKIPSTSAGLTSLRIAQISDLHVGPTIGLRYVERVVEIVRKLSPDITVLTGDIVDGALRDHGGSIEPFSRLEPRGRVFFSPGNHEYYHRLDQWIPEFERHGARILLNSGSGVEHNGKQVWVGGVTDPAGAQMRVGDAPDAKKAAHGGHDAHFKLLLSHRPGLASEAHTAGFDLQLSGHTHGGQFFPWTFVARFFHRYLHGLFRHETMWIYVSPGTGTWGPPARLGTTPEVTLIELT